MYTAMVFSLEADWNYFGIIPDHHLKIYLYTLWTKGNFKHCGHSLLNLSKWAKWVWFLGRACFVVCRTKLLVHQYLLPLKLMRPKSPKPPKSPVTTTTLGWSIFNGKRYRFGPTGQGTIRPSKYKIFIFQSISFQYCVKL